MICQAVEVELVFFIMCVLVLFKHFVNFSNITEFLDVLLLFVLNWHPGLRSLFVHNYLIKVIAAL